MMTGTYEIIYADPPWRYSAKKVQGAAENHYPTMSIGCSVGCQCFAVYVCIFNCDRTDKEAVCGSGERVVGEFGSLF